MKYVLPLLLCSVFLIFAFADAGQPSDVARIHIIANSDSKEDIELKMKVAEAVTRLLKKEKFNDLNSMEEGLEEKLEELELTALEIIKNENFPYGVKGEVGVRHFDKRNLGNSSFPEGDYLALTLTLGEGAGHNWWSVIFPEISLGASLAYGEEEARGKTVILSDGTIIRIRSFIADLFHDVFKV